MSNLSSQLIHLRKKLGLTQRQLADKVGIDQTMISDYEMGKFIPSLKTIHKFAKQGILISLDGQVDLDGQLIAQIKDYEVEEIPDVSKQLINLRRSLKISQSELAELVGVHKNTIARIERKEVFPDQATLQKFVDSKIDLNQYTEEEEMTDTAREIIKIRENLGLNQSAFARKIGVSSTTLCEIESGKRHLTTTTLRKIADKTGISLSTNIGSLNSKTATKNQIQTAAKEISNKFGITWFDNQEGVVMRTEIGKIKFTFNIANKTFELGYSNHEYENNTYTYTLILNQKYFDFLKFLSVHYPSQVRNMEVDNVEKVLLLISHNNTNYFYTLQIKGDTFTGIVTFKPSNFEDIFEKASEEVIEEETTEMTKPLTLEDKQPEPERDIFILCQNIIQIRDLLDETLELAQKIIQPIVDKEKELVEVKKERQIIEVIHKVYKQETDSTNRIYVGTKTLNDGIIFRVAPESEKLAKETWKTYQYTFSYQTETHYDDGTVELEDKVVFNPSTKIQEIESSDRKGVIGYVEYKAGIVEVVYYDRFVN